MKYQATEKAWVRKILRRLTPQQREEYERRCKEESAHLRHRNGKLYDTQRAEIAEQILLEGHRERHNANV